MGRRKAPEEEPIAAEVLETLPAELRILLDKGAVRTLEDVTDITAMFTLLVAEQQLPMRLSKEVRLWTELMFSSVAAKNATPQNEVNVIGQLMQQAVVGDMAPKQIDEVIDLDSIVMPKTKVVNGR